MASHSQSTPARPACILTRVWPARTARQHPAVVALGGPRPHPTLALTLWPSPSSPHPGQALSFRTFERDAKRALDAVAAKSQACASGRTFSPNPNHNPNPDPERNLTQCAAGREAT